jgi:hypothetical protein
MHRGMVGGIEPAARRMMPRNGQSTGRVDTREIGPQNFRVSKDVCGDGQIAMLDHQAIWLLLNLQCCYGNLRGLRCQWQRDCQ